MIDHINQMKSLADQLEAIDAPVQEDDLVTTLLCSLPEQYKNLITALESRAGDLSMEFVVARCSTKKAKTTRSTAFLGKPTKRKTQH